MGVKTIYRDFSSSRVCIIREVPKDSASTTLGQKTGLEPYALPVINHPTPNAFHDRPVEGFSLLVDLPCISKSRWQPSKFDYQTAEKFESVRNGVFEFYAIENPKRSEWDTWFELHCPFTSDVHEYLKSHIMLRPLESVFNLNVKIEQYWLQHATIPQFSVGSELSEQDWIDMAPAMTQDSVACRFNIHPPPPILFFANGGDHVTSFLENVVRYYDKVLSISTNAYLVYLLKRKIDVFGGAVKVSGKSKLQLEGLVKEHNRYFVQERYRSLNRLDEQFVQSAKRLSPVEPASQVISTICDGLYDITRSMVNEIASSCAVSPELVNICLHLFREREEKIGLAYFQSNRVYRNSVVIFDTIYNDTLLDRFEEDQNFDNIHRIYFPILESGLYRLIIADVSEKELLYVDPRVNCSLPEATRDVIDGVEEDRLKYQGIVRDVFRRFENYFYPETDEIPVAEKERWKSSQYPEFFEGVAYFEPIDNIIDSSIYILHFMDFDMNDIPPIFFKRDIERVRLNMAFSVLKGSFPL